MDNLVARDLIQEVKLALEKQEDSWEGTTDNCPVTHYFQDGIYTREIFLPKGTFLVSKIHRYDHPGFIMIGKCLVFTEKEGKQLCEAPRMMLTSAGTQRVICVLEDTVWCTVHRTNAQTAEEAEKFLTAPDYEDRVLTQNQSEKLEALLCQ